MIMKAGKSSKPVVKKKSGFVYKKRDPKTVRARAEQSGGNYDGVFKNGFDSYTAKMGDNCIRFLPPTWPDHDHYGLDIWVHGYVGVNKGSYLCPMKMKNKSCPICDAAAASKEEGEEEEGKRIEAKRRVLTWVMDRDGDSKTPQLYSMSWSMDKDISTLADNKRSGEVLLLDHPDEGYDVSFKRTGQKLNTRYIGIAIDRSPSSISDRQKDQDAVLAFIEENPLPSVLLYKSTEYLEKIIDGTAEEKDEELDEETTDDGDEEEETSSKKKPKAKVKRRDPDEDEDTAEEDDDPPFDPDEEDPDADPDEEEEEVRPSSKKKPKPVVKKARRPDPDEEDPDADPDEEEEPVRSSSKRKPARRDPDEDNEEESSDDGEETQEEGDEDPDADPDEDTEEEEEVTTRRKVRPVTKKGRR